MHLGINGIAVGRRRLNNAHITGTHQRELQRARNGRGTHREGVHIGLHLAQFLFHGHTELLLLVNNEQSQVLPLHGLANQLVRTYDNIYLSGFQVGQNLLRLFCTTGTRKILHAYRESFQARGERLIMLIGKHGGGHQHGHLLGIAGCLEGGANGYLRLSESHISTDQSVHRTGTLHIGLHVVGGLQLVGRILIKERSLQFVLHKGIGAEGKAFLPSAGSIEFDQVAGNILYLGFRPLLHPLPGTCSQGGKARLGLAVLTLVFRNLVERMDAHVHLVVIGIDDADDLLVLLGVGRWVLGVGGNDGDSYQSGKLSDTQIHMHDIIAGLHLLQFLHRERHLAVAGGIRTEVVLMITVEYLVVGEKAEF